MLSAIYWPMGKCLVGLASALLAVVVVAPAWAEGAPADRMTAAMTTYFGAEKSATMLVMGIGGASLLFSGIALARGNRTFKAMAAPIGAIGLLQIIVGASVYFRTDAQVAAFAEQMASDPGAFTLAELTRMEVVNRGFGLYKWIEIGLLAAGAAAVAVGARRENQIVLGVGIGLVAQSTVMLAFDMVAQDRALDYVRELGRFRMFADLITDDIGQAVGAALTWGGRF